VSKPRTEIVASTGNLPSPTDRPDASIVIFDGKCRFCQFQVRRLCSLDWQHKLAFLSLHDPEVARRWPDLTYDNLMKEMYIVDQKGNRFAGAAAIRWLSRKLIPLWPLMPFLHLPLSTPVWKFLYQQVAKRRYRFGQLNDCDNGTCQVHWR
jgi:predicted DCC family thiol-disulfide oxidoreductase YuxK